VRKYFENILVGRIVLFQENEEAEQCPLLLSLK